MENPDLTTSVGSLKFKNPVITASGTFGYGLEHKDLLDLNELGGIVVKGISLKPKSGNPPQRIIETPCGMLNAIGLANIGFENFLKDKLPLLKQYNTVRIVNIYGHSIEEYKSLAEKFSGIDGVDALEVNISCPNVAEGGMVFGIDAALTARVTEAVKKNTDKFVIVKLSPNVTNIQTIARAAVDGGADAISLINTLTGMAIDIKKRTPVLANTIGGLSGPAIRPIALYLVHKVVSSISIPVIGMGGIMSASDALEFLIAGARAVQIGTANFVNPRVTIGIIEGIREYCRSYNIAKIEDLVGTLRGPEFLGDICS